MMQRQILLCLLFIATMFAACKKDKKEIQKTVDVTGYWTGQASITNGFSFKVGILNRPNNTIRFYQFDEDYPNDSTKAEEKMEGTWFIKDNKYVMTIIDNDNQFIFSSTDPLKENLIKGSISGTALGDFEFTR